MPQIELDSHGSMQRERLPRRWAVKRKRLRSLLEACSESKQRVYNVLRITDPSVVRAYEERGPASRYSSIAQPPPGASKETTRTPLPQRSTCMRPPIDSQSLRNTGASCGSVSLTICGGGAFYAARRRLVGGGEGGRRSALRCCLSAHPPTGTSDKVQNVN